MKQINCFTIFVFLLLSLTLISINTFVDCQYGRPPPDDPADIGNDIYSGGVPGRRPAYRPAYRPRYRPNNWNRYQRCGNNNWYNRRYG